MSDQMLILWMNSTFMVNQIIWKHTFDSFSLHQCLFIFETWLISHNSSFEWNHGGKNMPKDIPHHTWYCKHSPGKTCRNYPEYTSHVVTIAGRVPLNILTWPRLTFLAARQTLVYLRLFIKHTLIINNRPSSHPSQIWEIFSGERKQSDREWAECTEWRAPML